MSRSSLSLLFPGCEAFDDDINVDINTAGTPADTADAATEAEDLATEGAETQSEAEETSTAAEAFAHQFSELCALQKHIARFGVDRTFLALCNRNNILGRALNLRLPAMESFDSVGSPRSATSIACLEALSEGLWQKFKDFISRICKAVRNFILKMTQWWNEVSGNYETRLQKYVEFFKTAEFKEQSDLEGFKGDWISKSDAAELISTMDDIKTIGDKDEARILIGKAEKVIDAVLRLGSSARATYGRAHQSTEYQTDKPGYPEVRADSDIPGSPYHRGESDIKGLADELSEKAQEDRDKILDKLSDWKDKVDDKLDSITDKMKDQDANDIIQEANGNYGQPAEKSANDFITSASKFITQIRKDQDRDKQFNQALSMALERLDRKATAKEGSPMDLDTRDAITRSVTTAQQILTKVNLAKTVFPKLLNLYFKNLATLKSMCKVQ